MNYKQELAQALTQTGLPYDELLNAIEVPERNLGDFAFPCFKLAKELKKAPPAIATELADKLQGAIPFVADIKAVGPYLNFYLDRTHFASTVVGEALQKGNDYGKSDIGTGKNIVIDYSSPNIAKPFHVGHLRSTVIGQALYNIYSHLGYNCIGVNHLGDWGTQFGKLVIAYRLWSSKEEIEQGGITALNAIYVKFHEEAEKNKALEDDARAAFLAMEEGDEETIATWRFFYDISLKEFEKVYAKLGITFDHYLGESFYSDKMQPVVEELETKKILQLSEGAKIVDLEDSGLPPCMIIRSDGGTLYATRDLATALYRKKTYNFYRAIYVTATDQSLHFKQFFKVLEKMGYAWANDLYHVTFGLVSLPEGKLSTRKGNVVLMQDILDAATDKAKEIIEEKNPDLANKDTVAAQVGIGAIIFNDMYNQRTKDVVFSFDKMLSFEGETGPFVQYSHARANSVLKKATDAGFATDFSNINYAHLTDDEAQTLIANIYYFKDKLIDVTEKHEPYLLTRQLVEIAQSFNKFYQVHHINTEDESIKNARLALVQVTKQTLYNGLRLLGINAPEAM